MVSNIIKVAVLSHRAVPELYLRRRRDRQRKGGRTMAASQDFQDFIDEVVERNDIVEVISGYAKLKRVGSRYAALCPLHNDKKSPSLSISPDKQLFHCFGCGAGGTVIQFIMGIENLDYMDALKYLADRAHLPMPERGSSADRKNSLLYTSPSPRD